MSGKVRIEKYVTVNSVSYRFAVSVFQPNEPSVWRVNRFTNAIKTGDQVYLAKVVQGIASLIELFQFGMEPHGVSCVNTAVFNCVDEFLKSHR